MKTYEIRLELGANPDFPHGSKECGYRLQLPLTEDFKIDTSAWNVSELPFRVTRFWQSEPEREGKVVLKWGDAWYFEFPDGVQEPVFQLENEVLLPGGFVDVRDHGDQMHIFKVVSLSEPTDSTVRKSTNHTESELPDAKYYNVTLSINPGDGESFLGCKYELILSLDENGHVNYAEWEKNPKRWLASYTDSSDFTRKGDITASTHLWYVHFKEPTETYELIRHMEHFKFVDAADSGRLISIRDISGHWHSYRVDAVEKINNPC